MSNCELIRNVELSGLKGHVDVKMKEVEKSCKRT